MVYDSHRFTYNFIKSKLFGSEAQTENSPEESILISEKSTDTIELAGELN